MEKQTSLLGVILSITGALFFLISLLAGISSARQAPDQAIFSIVVGLVVMLLFFAIGQIIYLLKNINRKLDATNKQS